MRRAKTWSGGNRITWNRCEKKCWEHPEVKVGRSAERWSWVKVCDQKEKPAKWGGAQLRVCTYFSERKGDRCRGRNVHVHAFDWFRECLHLGLVKLGKRKRPHCVCSRNSPVLQLRRDLDNKYFCRGDPLRMHIFQEPGLHLRNRSEWKARPRKYDWSRVSCANHLDSRDEFYCRELRQRLHAFSRWRGSDMGLWFSRSWQTWDKNKRRGAWIRHPKVNWLIQRQAQQSSWNLCWSKSLVGPEFGGCPFHFRVRL